MDASNTCEEVPNNSPSQHCPQKATRATASMAVSSVESEMSVRASMALISGMTGSHVLEHEEVGVSFLVLLIRHSSLLLLFQVLFEVMWHEWMPKKVLAMDNPAMFEAREAVYGHSIYSEAGNEEKLLSVQKLQKVQVAES